MTCSLAASTPPSTRRRRPARTAAPAIVLGVRLTALRLKKRRYNCCTCAETFTSWRRCATQRSTRLSRRAESYTLTPNHPTCFSLFSPSSSVTDDDIRGESFLPPAAAFPPRAAVVRANARMRWPAQYHISPRSVYIVLELLEGGELFLALQRRCALPSPDPCAACIDTACMCVRLELRVPQRDSGQYFLIGVHCITPALS